MTQSNSRNLPLLAVTLGDVAGIGPEITAKMLMGHEACAPRRGWWWSATRP